MSYLITAAVFFLDQFFKIFFLKYYPNNVVFNKGISFGLFPSDLWLVVNLFILVAAVLLIKRNNWQKALIIGGGASNLIDRFFRGKVVDYINLNLFLRRWDFHLPVFNLGDLFICIGVLCFFLRLSPSKKLL